MIRRGSGISASVLVSRALAAGASLAGVVALEELRSSPSHVLEELPDRSWSAGSVLVLGLAHPGPEPELDWWDGDQGTAGNRLLIQVNQTLIAWLGKELGIRAFDLPYHPHRKDAAVLAGLGMIGRNNLLLAAGLGPRLRLRGLILEAELPPTPRDRIDPCAGCPAPCWSACPQEAFAREVFSRERCNLQMEEDRAAAVREAPGGPGRTGLLIRYCRACELACPRGRRA